MENAPTEVSSTEKTELKKRDGSCTSCDIHKKSMDAEKYIPVGNIPILIFLGGPPNMGVPGNTQGAWDPERSLAVVT